MGFYKRNIDGTIQSANTQLDNSWLPLSDLEVDENNNYYDYYNIDGTPDVDKIALEDAEAYKARVKEAILKAIDTMRVEVDGLAYDGNEPSQARMDRAIQTLVGDEPITWRMYDNSTETLTQTHLGKALRAAGVMQTKLWFCSSIEEVETLVGADTEWYAKYSGGEA